MINTYDAISRVSKLSSFAEKPNNQLLGNCPNEGTDNLQSEGKLASSHRTRSEISVNSSAESCQLTGIPKGELAREH